MIWVLIAVGGSIGALSRWFVASVVPDHRSGFPLPITIVNVVGSFALGLAVGLDRSRILSIDLLPLTLGALGGFTTFSTWMVDIDTAPSRRVSIVIAVVPTILGVAAAAFGIMIGNGIPS
ncbi:MAG: CrcB family protein [Actinomycetia bacterium]|nr:CrcB family protein [Actinomycetes bacterium]